MARLLIRCPVTSTLVSTGLDIPDSPGFRRLVPRSGVLEVCSGCRRMHAWWRGETYLEGRPERSERRDMH